MAFLSRAVFAVTGALLVSASAAAVSQIGVRGEDEIKAAFLFNFMKFVEWPPARPRGGPLTLCVSGDDAAIADALGGIVRGQRVGDRPVIVRHLDEADDPRACHSLFIGAEEGRAARDLLARVRDADVLTVGETPYFLVEGGLVRFYVDNNRVRFQIDGAAASRAGLRISAQLLSLAR